MSSRRFIRRVACASFVTLACGACGSTHPAPPSTTGDASGGDAGSMCAAVATVPILGPQSPNVDAACAACMEADCCPQISACAGDAACASIVECMAACPSLGPVGINSACFTACGASNTAGAALSKLIFGCQTSSCEGPCADFDCLGTVAWPAPRTPSYTFEVNPTDGQVVLAGATIKVCGVADAACAHPSATYTTDAAGKATVTAPSSAYGIDGYLEVSSAGHLPLLAYVYVVGGGASLGTAGANASFSPTLVSTTAWVQETSDMGITPDPTRGHLSFVAVDCAAVAEAGVHVEVSSADASTVPLYGAGSVPETDWSGLGLIVNLPAGPGTVTATLVDQGERLATEQVAFRAGAITSVTLVPTP